MIGIEKAEEEAFRGDTTVHFFLRDTIKEIRRLRHELENPEYMYAGTRIGKSAILCRNAQIEALQEEIKNLKDDDV